MRLNLVSHDYLDEDLQNQEHRILASSLRTSTPVGMLQTKVFGGGYVSAKPGLSGQKSFSSSLVPQFTSLVFIHLTVIFTRCEHNCRAPVRSWRDQAASFRCQQYKRPALPNAAFATSVLSGYVIGATLVPRLTSSSSNTGGMNFFSS